MFARLAGLWVAVCAVCACARCARVCARSAPSFESLVTARHGTSDDDDERWPQQNLSAHPPEAAPPRARTSDWWGAVVNIIARKIDTNNLCSGLSVVRACLDHFRGDAECHMWHSASPRKWSRQARTTESPLHKLFVSIFRAIMFTTAPHQSLVLARGGAASGGCADRFC